MTPEETLFQRFGKEFAEGITLFNEGELGGEMFVLQSGKIKISKRVHGAEKVLAYLGPGEFFGELALISNRPRNATATATESSKLLVIDPKTFEAMIRSNAEIAVRMIKKLAQRLSEADTQIEHLRLNDPSSRVVRHLLLTCQVSGTTRDIEIDLKAFDFQQLLGIDKPALGWILNKLERSGMIELHGDRLTVRELSGLEEYLSYLEMKWKFGDL